MKKYILIQNDGEIESNSFELIGASTKRDQKDKIGFFGSGLKYSIAFMMRKGIQFKIFSGERELVFTTKKEKLKDQTFERICINGVQTSYTTTMGPTWTEEWYVLREIYCNALDEESCEITKETEFIIPVKDKTRIFIELTDPLKEVVKHWDSYFSYYRTPLFNVSDIYTCHLGADDGGLRQKISVYHRTVGILYRKGVRVHSSDKYLFDYDCNCVSINEDRTAKYPDGLGHGVVNMMALFCNEPYIKSILRTATDEKSSEEYMDISCGIKPDKWSDEWVRFSKENLLIVREIADRFDEDIKQSRKEVFLMPAMFARELKKSLPDANVIGMGNVVGDISYSPSPLSSKMSFLLSEVLKALKDMGYDITFDISVVEFSEENILGKADIENRKILLSARVFDMGRREIAMTLMEENEHIKSGENDETRAFQTHIFSQWLKSIEELNNLYL